MGTRCLSDLESARSHALTVAGVVAALRAEARTLGTARLEVERADGVARLADGTLIAVSGMGAASAAASAAALLEAGAYALVSWGMAGGLDPALSAGDLCLPLRVIGQDGAEFPTHAAWRAQFAAALPTHCVATSGTLFTSPLPLGERAAKAAAFRATGAAAVDMESAAVAAIAAARDVPFLAVRAIVDTAGDTLPAAVLAAGGGTGQVRILRLLAGLLSAPQEVVPLVRLARRYRAAIAALTAAAAGGLRLPDRWPNEP